MSAAELILATGNEPATPATNRLLVYAGSDNRLYAKDSSGTLRKLAVADGDLVIGTGDTLTAPGGGGTAVVKGGTPADQHLARWTDDHTITGSSSLSWDGSSLSIGGSVASQGQQSELTDGTTRSLTFHKHLHQAGTPLTAQDVCSVDVTTTNAAVLVALRLVICRAGDVNGAAVYDVFAHARNNGPTFTAPTVSLVQAVVSITAPTAAWSGTGTVRSLHLTAGDEQTTLAIVGQVAATQASITL